MSAEQESPTHHPSSITIHALDRTPLRLAMRDRRKAVPKSVRNTAAHAIARHVSHTHLLRKGQRIAVYRAFDGEIDLSPIIQRAQIAGCVTYAPRIGNMLTRKMEFVELPHHTGVRSSNNRLVTIREPRANLQRRINPRLLDLVFVPLVAFDVYGWRLGFGAGFYDRKFAFLRRQFKRKPLLIGIGYEFQRVPPQEPREWDVLLDAVITERGVQFCRTPQIVG